MKQRSANVPEIAPAGAEEMDRRDFNRLLVTTVAGSALGFSPLASAHEFADTPLLTYPEQEHNQPALSSAAQAEVEAKLRHIFATHGDRLNDDQKKRLRRTVTDHVRMLEAIRPFHEANGDPPATVLTLVHDPPHRGRTNRRSASATRRRIEKSPRKGR